MSPNKSGSLRSHKPTIFIDRCIPDRFERAIRPMGVEVVAMTAHFADRSMEVADTEWIELVGRRQWVAFTQNPAIWWNEAERSAVREHSARIFCLASAQHLIDTKGVIYGRWWLSIMRRSRRPDPCFWRLDPQATKKDLP